MAVDHKVTQLPTPLERIAARAGQAMIEYRAGETDQSKGKQRSIHAVIAYGRALLEGREGRSNQAFSQWVSESKLDVGKPWDDQRERTAAMNIASAVHGSIPVDVFDACPNTRPTDIMKWYRNKTGTPKDDRPKNVSKRTPNPIRKARNEKIVALANQGASSREIAAEVGLGERNVHQLLEHERIRVEAHTELLDAAAAENFLEKGKLKIEDAIRIHKARLDRQFEQVVNAEVRRRIDAADDAARASNKRLHLENIDLRRIVGQRGVFSETQFRQMLMLCHPDSSAGPQLKAELLQVLIENKIRLIKPEK